MPDIDLEALRSTVVWASLALGLVLGAVMHRTNFCTMGAIADIVNMGDWNRMRMWVCAIGVAIVGTQLLAATGLVDPAKTIYTGARLTWLSYLVGGFLFGFGMVLASGCGSKTLVRLGAGSLKSVVVFIALGLGAYMTLKGLTAVWRVSALTPVATSMAPRQDLPRLLADGGTLTLVTAHLVLGLAIGGALIVWALASREFRTPLNLLGGIVPGLVIVGVWYVSGHIGYVPEHPDTLEEAFVATNSGRAESFSFVAPIAYTIELFLFWSDASRIVTVGIAAVFGMIAGSLLSALATRQFRWEGFGGTEDTANHLVGGLLMGIGGVTALGCTIGQGMSGVSTLALGSFVALAAIGAGAVAALKYQYWRIERMI
ncbi:MAG TPA: YeeE/YedE family protein [Burkholderiaceae bacterium]|nr:YeeE/YedE family protein [Burkholderiaceae bacterium]